MDQALGLLETRGLVCAVVAADAMLKTSQVRLLRQHVTRPALVCILIEGETAAVRASLEAGRKAASRVGPVVATHLIPRPSPSLRPMLEHLASGSHALGPAAQEALAAESFQAGDLGALGVPKLRALARSLSGFALSGREISTARREALLDALRKHLGRPSDS